MANSFMLMQSSGNFPARLKSPAGEVLAEGEAQLSRVARTVTFRSDFVPLYPPGTPLEILRLLDDQEIHRFFGKVYLSDRQLLRLTGVDDELLPGSELAYCGGLPYTGRVRLDPPPAPLKKHFLSFRSAPPARSRPVSVAIPEMTDTQLVILYDSEDILTPGQQFLLAFDAPIRLVPVHIELIRSGLFAEAQPRLCRFVGLNETDRKSLRELLAIYNMAHHKLF